MTNQIQTVGNPFSTQCQYARNVWDIRAFNGKLYLGSGNASNANPCINAGPVPIMAYDPATNSFSNEYTAPEEQIDGYVMVNGQLLVPGNDPREDFTFGNWYRLEGGSWTKHRNLPNIIHAFDVASYNGKLFVAGGSQVWATSGLQISSDDGASWSSSNVFDIFRFYNFLKMNGQLYVVRLFYLSVGSSMPAVYQYTGGTNFTALTSIGFAQMFPSTSTSGITEARITRPINFLGSTVYIGAKLINDTQSDPFGLYVSSTIGNAQRNTLPRGAKPWDLKVGQDGALYALGSVQNGDGSYTNTVSRTTDLVTWTEQFSFSSATFARSFEWLGDSWYFGMGQDTTLNAALTGTILRFQP